MLDMGCFFFCYPLIADGRYEKEFYNILAGFGYFILNGLNEQYICQIILIVSACRDEQTNITCKLTAKYVAFSATFVVYQCYLFPRLAELHLTHI